ncbi:MAG: TIGR03088 family PEP-CTERM/XrtA system glycosyltransferase [Paucibacter sp.]|nr:TIGR03088 family PEP-CTERM/XrtA system glycosyltransferase [Roseateles sp.]
MNAADPRPLVVHVMHRFDTGGLENGVVNLINHMPPERWRHAVLALTEVTDFRRRVRHEDVQFIALNKPPGQGFWQFPKLFSLFRTLRPAIVHSRNLAALETQLPAWAAGVPVRIHGEHGRDVGDLDGSNRTYQRVRRFYRPFVNHYIALSRDLETYLREAVHVPAERISQFYNGVDAERFKALADGPSAIEGCPFDPARHFIFGTVGRMAQVKDQTLLARAFVQLIEQQPAWRERVRLVMIGDGPLRAQAQALLDAAGLAELAWLPGERTDVPAVMRGLNAFVLPSLAEGISNTILEAMASGLPVIATDVGGNADLVEHEQSGLIVPAADAEALRVAMARLAADATLGRQMGRAGRARIERQFSLQAMVRNYQGLYERLRGRADRAAAPVTSSEV